MSAPSSPNDGQSGRKEFFRNGLNQQPLYQQQQQQQLQHQHQLTLQQQPFMNNNNNITLQQQQAPLLQQQQTTAGLNTATAVTAVQPPPPPPAQYLHWANPLVGGAPFLQSTPQPQRATVPPTHQQQQQHFNDFLFNIQAQAAYAAAAAAVPPPPPPSAQPSQVGSPSSPQETYSVLRVGNGNFLKIYHCAENAMNPLPGETSFTSMTPYNQPQTAAFHHINTQGAPAVPPALQQQQQPQPPQTQTSGSNSSAASPQAFNSYELFSSSTFTQLPTAEMPPLLLLGPTTQVPPLATDDFTDNEQNLKQSQLPNNATKNMIIPNMPTNWAGSNNPTTGPLCAQFDKRQNESLDLDNSSASLANIDAPTTTTETPNNNDSTNSDTFKKNTTLENTLNAHIAIQQTPSVKSFTAISSNTLPSTSPITITKNTEIPRQDAPKKRIVAEVKPMRMTYSDVLSKFNNQTQNSQQHQNQNNLNNNNNNNTLTTNSAVNTVTSAANRQQQKAGKLDTNSNNLRRNGCGDDTITASSSTIRSASSKKSPTHENKENQQSQQQQLINNKLNYNNQKRSSSSTVINNGNNNTSNSLNVNNNNTNNNSSSISKTSSATTIQKNLINNSKNNINSNNSSYNTNDNPSLKKPRSNKNSDTIQNNSGVKSNNSEQQRGTAKNNVNPATNQTSPTANTYNSTNNTYGRKLTKSSNSGNTSSSAGLSRSRYQNNSNASYSYSSTKRSRNNSSYGTSSSSFNNTLFTNGSGSSNRNYELAKRFLQAWYTYTMKILTWLFYLVYDIVVLGCSILYERLTYAFECGKAYGKQLHKDLKQNSNKPSIWFKNYCRKFDGKFSKTSKWAFWRKFYKKKPPETASESIKTGRLPATGEEAMYQLLNCKGKDAYSILGVPPNSSPEQIRKHYKKIAVLVHPDKNKQAGAEEAFKVLQRAFELIGEPENRLAYDQSLAEALHAEKAWTELHDLLSQLQTKITEAANTIRCSTCGLRHPRRITDRPHYAARECASCKIRHSAREGDIWAETSLLGLRWKYLALMEGKVYDITEWANCQKGALAHLEPNSHMVQYRIVRGAQQQQQQQQQQQHQQKQQAQQQQQQQHHQKQHTGSQYTSGGGVGGKFKRDTTIPPSEASLHEFLDNLYSGQHPQQQQNTSAYAGSSRRRNRRN